MGLHALGGGGDLYLMKIIVVDREPNIFTLTVVYFKNDLNKPSYLGIEY